MRHDDDRVVLLELLDEVFDREGRDRVEGRTGLVHEDDLGLHGDSAGDAQSLLLATREAVAGPIQAVLDLVPEVGALERLLDELVGVGLRDALVVELDAREDVVSDRHGRERVRALEDHADLSANPHGVDPGAVEIVAVDEHFPVHPRAGNDLVHAVESSDERRLAAPRRPDERRNAPGLDDEVDTFDGLELAVVDVQVVDFDAL